MNRIKILSEKISVKNCLSYNKFVNYTNQLSEHAKQQPGFISSNTYFKEPLEMAKLPINVITISEWKNMESWENWYNSDIRNEIYNDFKDTIKKEEYNLIFKKNNINDIFLL